MGDDRLVQDVAYPDRRDDVVAALERLAAIDRSTVSDWPDLTNSVHWLVDDTFWDVRPASSDIGTILRSQAEADAVTAVIEPLIAVLEDLDPAAEDLSYLAHPRWADVPRSAANACDLLRSAG